MKDAQDFLSILGLPLPEAVETLPGLFRFDIRGNGPDQKSQIHGIGVDENPEIAKAKAASEALERYFLFAGILRNEDLCPTPLSYDPIWDQYELFTAEQKRSHPEIASFQMKPRRWLRVANLHMGGETEIPSYMLDAFITPRVALHNSNGWAWGNELAGTQERALAELVERHAVLWHWWTRTSPQSLSTEGFEATEAFLAQRGLKLDLLYFPQATPFHVIAATVRGDNCFPRLLVGLGAHLDPREAARKAVRELANPFVTSIPSDLAPPMSFDHNLFTIYQRQNYFWYHAPEISWKFLYSGESCSWETLQKTGSSELQAKLKSTKLRCYAFYRRLPPEFPFFMVKAMSPDLLPLDIHHRYRPWGHPCLHGYELNSYPHPIP